MKDGFNSFSNALKYELLFFSYSWLPGCKIIQPDTLVSVSRMISLRDDMFVVSYQSDDG
jgi:hypothetical protein